MQGTAGHYIFIEGGSDMVPFFVIAKDQEAPDKWIYAEILIIKRGSNPF
mgnify:FL=1